MHCPQSKTPTHMGSGHRLQLTKPKNMSTATQAQVRQRATKNNKRCETVPGTRPLELLVVGHQLNMRPMASTLAPTALGRSRSVQRPLAKAVRYPVKPTRLVKLNVEEGESVYIYESFPTQLWSTQLFLANGYLLATDEHDGHHELPTLPTGHQVVDARFLAELLDELLMREE